MSDRNQVALTVPLSGGNWDLKLISEIHPAFLLRLLCGEEQALAPSTSQPSCLTSWDVPGSLGV